MARKRVSLSRKAASALLRCANITCNSRLSCLSRLSILMTDSAAQIVITMATARRSSAAILVREIMPAVMDIIVCSIFSAEEDISARAW